MDKDDVDYFGNSIRDSLFLIVWVSFATCVVVGAMLAIAM